MAHPFRFEGFTAPHYTQVPDEVFDILMPHLREAELKALLYIVRRTFGFKKDSDPISFNQFLRGIRKSDGTYLDRGCGIRDRTTLSKALKRLEKMGVIVTHKVTDEKGAKQTTVYSLRFKENKPPKGRKGREEGSRQNPPGGSRKSLPPRSRQFIPPLVGNPYLQQTEMQQKETTTNNPEDVVPFENSSSKNPQTDNSINKLLDQMEILGVSQKVATRLVKEQPWEKLQKLIDLTLDKLEEGWKPRKSVPAWFVAAAQDEGFRFPEGFKTRAEREEEQKEWKEKQAKMKEAEKEAWRKAKEREVLIKQVMSVLPVKKLEALRKRAQKEVLKKHKVLASFVRAGEGQFFLDQLTDWRVKEIIWEEVVPRYFPDKEGK